MVCFCETLLFFLPAIWKRKQSAARLLFLVANRETTRPKLSPRLCLSHYSCYLINLLRCEKQRLRHFCAALTVTRKFRLCLQPHGLLRVQSLHLPSRAWLGVFYTYSFLPVRSEIKTCQEQVSPRLSKMNFCPSAPCWGFRTPIPHGLISSHSFAEKTAKVFFEMIMARITNPRHLFC